ncbi:MAG: YDG/SRA domain-containing protein [Candidatus Bathyarchaeia archaeon]
MAKASLKLLPYTLIPVMLPKIGDVLSNREISRIFGVCAQRGIRYNGSLKGGIRYIVLITVLRKTPEESLRNPYNDRLEDDILLYTGEGRVGNQKMVRGNLALKRQMKEGFPIFVFEKKSPGKYMFLGQYIVLSVHVEIQPDIEGQRREVFLYKLKRVSHSVSLNAFEKLRFLKVNK